MNERRLELTFDLAGRQTSWRIDRFSRQNVLRASIRLSTSGAGGHRACGTIWHLAESSVLHQPGSLPHSAITDTVAREISPANGELDAPFGYDGDDRHLALRIYRECC
ncbi:MAG: hypothetical protein ACLU9X_11260 [Alistipes shahii]